METYDEKTHGKILWLCKRASVYTTAVSLLYVAFFVLFFIYLHSKGGAVRFLSVLPFLFSLWQIHRIHEPVAVICEKKLLISCSPFFERRNLAAGIKSSYIALDCSEVAGISEDWRFLFIGERCSGGIVEMPVPFTYISREDKIKLETWIDKQQRENQGL